MSATINNEQKQRQEQLPEPTNICTEMVLGQDAGTTA